MRHIVLILALSLTILAKNILLPESTIAVVNGMALYEDDLQVEIDAIMPWSAYHASTKGKKLDEVKEKAMKKLIDTTLLYQYALSVGIKPDKTIAENVYKKLLDEFGSKEKVEKELNKQHLSIDIITKLYNRNSALGHLYAKKIEHTISDKELKEYYEKNMYKFKEPEKIRISLIHVRNDPTDPQGKSKAKEKAEEALKKLKDGEAFADVASKYSNDMSRIKGGDMGFLHRGRLNEAVDKEAFSLKAGETSGIIEKDIGFFIVKVTEKKKQNQLPFKKIKRSLRKDLKKKYEDKKRDDLLLKLRAKAKIIN